jgi:hypothetical protein
MSRRSVAVSPGSDASTPATQTADRASPHTDGGDLNVPGPVVQSSAPVRASAATSAAALPSGAR